MKKSWQVLRHNRAYLWTATALFFIGWILGALLPDSVGQLANQGIEHIRDLAEKTQAKESGAYTSTVIFFNNLRAAVSMLLMGIPFAVMTVFALLLNGLTVGVVFEQVGAHSAVSSWEMILYGLLPHGIFELPAIFIMSAFGIKLGRVLLVPLQGKTRWMSFRHVWREVASISWVVLLLLVVAAAVEGMITPKLMHAFVGNL
jgi:stage II sporulation protein M